MPLYHPQGMKIAPLVIPAKAGSMISCATRTPAFAGVTLKRRAVSSAYYGQNDRRVSEMIGDLNKD